MVVRRLRLYLLFQRSYRPAPPIDTYTAKLERALTRLEPFLPPDAAQARSDVSQALCELKGYLAKHGRVVSDLEPDTERALDHILKQLDASHMEKVAKYVLVAQACQFMEWTPHLFCPWA